MRKEERRGRKSEEKVRGVRRTERGEAGNGKKKETKGVDRIMEGSWKTKEGKKEEEGER